MDGIGFLVALRWWREAAPPCLREPCVVVQYGEVVEVLQRGEDLHDLLHRGPGFGVLAQAAVSQLGHLLYAFDRVVELKARIHYLVHLPLLGQVWPRPRHEILFATRPFLVHGSPAGQDFQEHDPKAVDVAL